MKISGVYLDNRKYSRKVSSNMKVIVITGSTRGIGYGLANSFLNHNCRVMISGRTSSVVESAVEILSTKHKSEMVAGHCCDVRDYDTVKDLWKVAVDRFGKVDIWINNAGINHRIMKPWHLPACDIEAIIATNLLGVMYGSKVAVKGMLWQGHGAIYNMLGMGSDGRKMEGMSIYGSTKSGVDYFTKALVLETRDSPIIVGAVSPGMVMTDMLYREGFEDNPEEDERTKRVFNILADKVETVSPWLVNKILSNEKTGVRISWLTTWKIFARFLAAPFRKRDIYSESESI
jgi:NAD(P)-dependent dehydrogenase (short-subunit alcohol dehydrogenase family)